MAADLPSEPFNREEEYLADIAGQPGAEVPPCPWSRKEAYLDAISGRLSTMDDRISALATDLSFKGSVATESALPSGAAVGDTYITEDTGIMYVWVGDDWVAINDTGGGGIIELTSANYNYHKTGDTDDSIAPWLLNQGLYLVKAGTKMWFHKNQLGSAATFNDDVFMIIGATSGYATSFIMLLPGSNLYGGAWRFGDGTLDTVTGAGSGSNGLGLVRGTQIIDNLTSTNSDKVLSANQGKVLKELIDKRIPTFYTANDISEGFTDAPLYSTRNFASQIDGSAFYNALANGGFVLCQIVNNDVDIAYTVAGYTIPYANSSTGFDHYPPTAYITNGTTTMELSFTSAIPTSVGHFTCSEM